MMVVQYLQIGIFLACFICLMLGSFQWTEALSPSSSSSSSQNGRNRMAVQSTTKSAATTTTTIPSSHPPPPVVMAVDFGQDKLIKLFFPATSRQFTNDKSKIDKGTTMSTLYGNGDVIWPSGYALSQLIAYCPTIVNGRNVLELGCGLGVVSAAACKYSHPNHVALSDCDRSVLGLAYASCTQLQRSKASVSRCCMDWKDPSSWPAQEYDVVLAADVLYDKSSILPLVNVLQHYLCHNTVNRRFNRAVIVDPINQVNRDAFCFAAYKAGLDVEQEEFPGSSDLMLLSVTPSV